MGGGHGAMDGMRGVLGKIEAEPRGHRVGQKRQNLRAAMRSAQRTVALDIPVSVSAIPCEHGHTRSKGALAGSNKGRMEATSPQAPMCDFTPANDALQHA